MKTHWKKKVSDPNFIGEGDFQEGEEKVLTIERVNIDETVTQQQRGGARSRSSTGESQAINL